MQSELTVGQIVRAQGIHGEVKVRPLTDTPEQLTALPYVCIGSTQYIIEHARAAQGFAYLKLQGVQDRNAADRLHDAYLSVPREALPMLSEDQYYLCDLIGCTVVTDEGHLLGQVEDVLQAAGNDVYVVRGERSVLIPARKIVIDAIDIPNKRITVLAARLAEVAVFDD